MSNQYVREQVDVIRKFLSLGVPVGIHTCVQLHNATSRPIL
jgi:hypothetical protein